MATEQLNNSETSYDKIQKQIDKQMAKARAKREASLYNTLTVEDYRQAPEVAYTHDERETMRIQSLQKRRKDLQKLQSLIK
jgi:hypothetical protein